MPPVTGPTSSTIDPDKLGRLNTPEAQDVIRRGNIDEILKTTGISKKDWEDYLKSQNVSLNRDIVQDYQIYSEGGSVPSPQWTEGFSPELGVGKVTPQDHATFMESVGRITGKAIVAGGKSSTAGKAMEAPADLAAAVGGYIQEADDVIQGIADNALDAQLNLQVEEQAWAFARVSPQGSVVVAFNNATTPASLDFEVRAARLADGATLVDRLSGGADARVAGGRLRLTLPARSAAIYSLR